MNRIPTGFFDPNKFIDDWVNEKHPRAMKEKKTYVPSLIGIIEEKEIHHDSDTSEKEMQ